MANPLNKTLTLEFETTKMVNLTGNKYSVSLVLEVCNAFLNSRREISFFCPTYHLSFFKNIFRFFVVLF